MTMDESELQRFASKFVGIPIDDFSDEEEQFFDSIISEAIRYSITFGRNRNNLIAPVHGNYIRSWVYRKTRSILGSSDTEIKNKIAGILSGQECPNLESLGDIVRSDNGFFTPALPQAIKIKENNYLLVSGRPTIDFLRLGFRVRLNSVARFLICEDEERIRQAGIVLMAKSAYLGKETLRGTPLQYLEYCIHSFPSEKWISTIYDEAYLGNGFFSRMTPFNIELSEGEVTFWRTKLDYETKYQLQLITNQREKVAISIPVNQSKQVTLAIDSMLGKKRKATLYISESKITLELSYLPPPLDVRAFFALGGINRYSDGQSNLWEFDDEVKREVKDILSEIWVEIVEVNGDYFS